MDTLISEQTLHSASRLARDNMVLNQLRTNRVTDDAVLHAFNSIARELFLPAAQQGMAYCDDDLPLNATRYLMEPMIHARLVQEAKLTPTTRVLDVGCGSGYSTAILACLSNQVTALESQATLALLARNNLNSLGLHNLKVYNGPLAEGVASKAPFEVIIINGAVDFIPETLSDQLMDGGRIITALIDDGGVARGTSLLKRHGTLSKTMFCDANVARLPDLCKPTGFVF